MRDNNSMFITAYQQSCWKVMFLLIFVCSWEACIAEGAEQGVCAAGGGMRGWAYMTWLEGVCMTGEVFVAGGMYG